jgi:transposase
VGQLLLSNGWDIIIFSCLGVFKRVYTSKEIRKALDIYARLRSFRKTSLCTGFGKSTIHRWWNTFHGLIVRPQIRKKHTRKRKPKFPGIKDNIMSIFSSDTLSFFTIQSIQNKLAGQFQYVPSSSWIRKELKALRISRRRFQDTKVYSKDENRIKEKYRTFKQKLNKYNDSEIVCLDETGFCNIGNSLQGYFPKGKVPIMKKVSKRQRFSWIMAINSSGYIHSQLQAKPFNKATFQEFVISLIPRLGNGIKAVLMDNVAFHHSKDILALFETKGIEVIFIPPYSPRCNPIEEVFSFTKTRFRSSEKIEFNEKVLDAIEQTKAYKHNAKHYQHTRKHVEETCQEL